VNLLLCAILLYGPQPEFNRPALTIVVHLGRDHRSAIVNSELHNPHPFFKSIRAEIEQQYNLSTDDEALDEPTYSIGRGGERLKFRPGSFTSSGTFLLALKSIADIDHWERGIPQERYAKNEEGWYSYVGRDESDKPEEFPPRLTDP